MSESHTDADEPWRLFLALPLPSEAALAVERRCAPYRRRFASARWLPADVLHLTLLFIGGVAPDRVPQAARLATSVAAGRQAFAVLTGAGGGRTRDGDGVAWLGLDQGGPQVIELAAAALSGCPPELPGGGRAPRAAPSAHLTVARRAGADLLAALREQALGPLGVGWTADRVVLFRSHLGPSGARYEALAEAALAL